MQTPAPPAADRAVPVWVRDADVASLSDADRDYLFDLRGFDILENALSAEQLEQINAFIDAHDIAELQTGEWIGHVETHKYGASTPDGINFQNVIEAGPAFEACIDHPAWIGRVKRFVEGDSMHAVTIDENFLNVRQSGGFIPVHSGGSTARFTNCFRNEAGRRMVGQINVLMALTDIGPGDGCTTVVPGSHNSPADPPAYANGEGEAWASGLTGADVPGMVQVHLKAGDAVMFTDAITHGSIPRTNPGERRVMIYRYAPHLLAKRYNYLPSEELMVRLTERQRRMVQPQPPRFSPTRTLTFIADGGPTDVGPARD